MPNWIKNHMVIKTTSLELIDKLEMLSHPKYKDIGFLSAFFPRPTENKYEWSIQHWGTKWDTQAEVIPTRFEGKTRSFIVKFDTAWDTPHEFLFKFAHQFNQRGHSTSLDLHFIGLDEAICGYMATTPDIAHLTKTQSELVENGDIGWAGGVFDAYTIKATDPAIATRIDEVFPGFIDIVTNLNNSL